MMYDLNNGEVAKTLVGFLFPAKPGFDLPKYGTDLFPRLLCSLTDQGARSKLVDICFYAIFNCRFMKLPLYPQFPLFLFKTGKVADLFIIVNFSHLSVYTCSTWSL